MKILLVIDIQEKYMIYYDKDLLSRINHRIREAQAASVPVFYIRNIPRTESSENYDFASGLLFVSDYIYEKKSPSAFSSRAFVEDLKNFGITDIEMIGVDGNCCVKRSCLDAHDAGYGVILNTDCIGAKNEKLYKKTLSELAEWVKTSGT